MDGCFGKDLRMLFGRVKWGDADADADADTDTNDSIFSRPFDFVCFAAVPAVSAV